MFETLESRQFFSASPTAISEPIATQPAAPVVEVSATSARRTPLGAVPRVGGSLQLVVIAIIVVL